MKSAIYARVSTESQDHDSQLQECREWCARFAPNPTEYLDKASGSATSRLALDGLMAAIRKGKIDAVICYKLDRLGRSLSHLTQLFEEFDKYRVALICPSQGIDTRSSSPGARFQLQILGAVAEFERGIIKERVNAGLSAARKRGVHLGRPFSTSTSVPVAEARQQRANGKSLRALATEYGVPTTTLARALSKG